MRRVLVADQAAPMTPNDASTLNERRGSTWRAVRQSPTAALGQLTS